MVLFVGRQRVSPVGYVLGADGGELLPVGSWIAAAEESSGRVR